ncbi:MAG: PocR ligand-binding domain-containing protein [Chloroflexota bacterium]
MSDLLTTRQLQDLLQVDRVTIYRMLDDGRLAGFKVGGQWRFSRQEIEKWLREQRASLQGDGSSSQVHQAGLPADPLPLSCVQAIQAVCAEALDVAIVTTRPDGSPLTDISHSCVFCNLILATAEGRRRCAASWGLSAEGKKSPPAVRACHAGLLCVSLPVELGQRWVANVTGCQFAEVTEDGAAEWRARLGVLAADLGLAEVKLEAAANSVRLLAPERVSRVRYLLGQMAESFAKIAQERVELVGRLQRIAEITHI